MKRAGSNSTRTPLARDPALQVLRPLVEAYWAFWLEDSRHIRSLGLTPPQFDVIATLGNTGGLTCAELSRATLVTKGTLTGVLDRLEARGLIERRPEASDRRRVRIRLTARGDAVFRKTFPRHLAHIRPFFERALTRRRAASLSRDLLRLRDSFRGVAPRGRR
jgi:DNA-binding MarR family transcriptional regulator